MRNVFRYLDTRAYSVSVHIYALLYAQFGTSQKCASKHMRGCRCRRLQIFPQASSRHPLAGLPVLDGKSKNGNAECRSFLFMSARPHYLPSASSPPTPTLIQFICPSQELSLSWAGQRSSWLFIDILKETAKHRGKHFLHFKITGKVHLQLILLQFENSQVLCTQASKT